MLKFDNLYKILTELYKCDNICKIKKFLNNLLVGILKFRIGGKNMRHTGMTRSLDELGRIVLPKEIRESFNLNYKDALEIFVEDNKIILRKYQPGDIFDADMENLIEYKGKKVSLDSIKQLVKLAKEEGYEI